MELASQLKMLMFGATNRKAGWNLRIFCVCANYGLKYAKHVPSSRKIQRERKCGRGGFSCFCPVGW
jgi:hypothetical protein